MGQGTILGSFNFSEGSQSVGKGLNRDYFHQACYTLLIICKLTMVYTPAFHTWWTLGGADRANATGGA